MKTSPKTKKARHHIGSYSSQVSLAKTSVPLLRHFRLVEHKQTGKLIHHRHTSHLVLFVMLLIVGLFLYASTSLVQAAQLAASGAVSVGAVVAGPAPTIGATITAPASGANITNQPIVKVSGTCAPGTFVVVKNNSQLAGSTVCTDTGTFSLQVQLQLGANALSALNYDNSNQTGPATRIISFSLINPTGSQSPTAKPTVSIVLPDNPSVIPGVDSKTPSCDNPATKALPATGELQVAVTCVPRFVQANTQYVLSAQVWGGTPPYALAVSRGDSSADSLHSYATQGTKIIKFSYAQAGTYKINLKLTDSVGTTVLVQTAVQADAEAQTTLAVLAGSIFSSSWFETPIPLYLLALGVTLGFWGGDIFDRNYGARKPRSRARKIA